MAHSKLTRIVDLKGLKEREAQAHAQKIITEELLDETAHPKYRLMANYATGVGKGKAAIDAAIHFYEKISKKPMFLGVWTESQRDNVWREQIAEWGGGHTCLDTMQRECYASMHNIKGNHYGLVILDEAQHLTELGYKFFEQNTFEGVLILTATQPKDPEKKAIINRLTYGRRLVIKTDAAIEAGILNDFRVRKVLIDLDDTDKYKMFENSNTLYTDWTGYLKHCQLVDSAIRSRDQVRIRFAAIARMRFVGNTRSKRLAAKYLQDQYRAEGKRFITIANSIEQANMLSTHVFHSESTKEHYEAFKAGAINELISIKQIREAENFYNLGKGLIVQVDQNANNTVQITGRLLRLPIGEMSEIDILVARNTMDEGKWIKKALEDTNVDKISQFKLEKELYWKPRLTPIIKP